MDQNDLLYDANRIVAITLTVIVGVIGRFGYAKSYGKTMTLNTIVWSFAMSLFVVFVGENILSYTNYKDLRLPILSLASFFSKDIIAYVDRNKTKYWDRIFKNNNNDDKA